MLILLLCMAALVVAYFTYGKFVEKVFQVDADRETPANALKDGVDYIPLPTWKVLMIQLLNIAGIGPIFGPILGALYGPSALIWIVLGAIFGGAVHDFFSGMLSLRQKGVNMPEVIGGAFGRGPKVVMQLFSLLLLLLVGVIFVLAPAKLLHAQTKLPVTILIIAIFTYYFIATILPIDKLIARIYPLFGALLLFMTFGVGGMLLFSGVDLIPNTDFVTNAFPVAEGATQKPLWPLLFITLSCGAISGFHATQSPLMARCLKTEKHGRMVFYGGMLMESAIALIWCAAGLSFYKSPEALQAAVAAGSPASVVNEVCLSMLGKVGGLLAIFGVIILPITSGDTAFRSARLIIAESFGMDQAKASKRLTIAVPLFIIAMIVSQANFSIVWRYFGWSNQTLAMLVLWTAAVYLARRKRFHWIATLPAVFMTAVSITFIFYAKIGFQLSYNVSVWLGVGCAAMVFVGFMIKFGRGEEADPDSTPEPDPSAA